ncbi:hypothetical protein D3C72_2567360 [compost metagenome]
MSAALSSTDTRQAITTLLCRNGWDQSGICLNRAGASTGTKAAAMVKPTINTLKRLRS